MTTASALLLQLPEKPTTADMLRMANKLVECGYERARGDIWRLRQELAGASGVLKSLSDLLPGYSAGHLADKCAESAASINSLLDETRR